MQKIERKQSKGAIILWQKTYLEMKKEATKMANLTNGQKVWASSSVPTAADLNNIEGNLKNHTHPTADLTDILPLSKGGTGATTAAAARNNLGLGNTTGKKTI